MEKIFVMNLGTTSFKFKFYAFQDQQAQVLATDELESIGAPVSAYEITYADGKTIREQAPVADHGAAFALCFSILLSLPVLVLLLPCPSSVFSLSVSLTGSVSPFSFLVVPSDLWGY